MSVILMCHLAIQVHVIEPPWTNCLALCYVLTRQDYSLFPCGSSVKYGSPFDNYSQLPNSGLELALWVCQTQILAYWGQPPGEPTV